MSKPTWKRGEPLSEKIQEQLRVLVRKMGDEKKAAALLEISATSIMRGAMGLGMRRGTILLIELKLAAVAEKMRAA